LVPRRPPTTERAMQRRDLLQLAALGAASLALESSLRAQSKPGPIIDAHIHLFDPTRPGGVPWPTADDTVLYKPALPDRYARIAQPLGIVGAIAIEASPLATDNQWLLSVAAKHPLIVGVIGDLIPGTATYQADLDRLHRDPLFLGIRYGNLWNRDLSVDLERPGFVDGLRALAQSNLVFESANPDAKLIHALLQVSQQVPGLRIVIDHLPHAVVPTDAAALKSYWSDLGELAKTGRVYVKLSEIPVRADGKLITDSSYYRESLDRIFNKFGEDRIIFGSDWPNGDHVAPFADTFAIARSYIERKGHAVAEKYFWKNSIAAYRWHRRLPDQPSL
jgi:L-fuconolactonase